jgi:adenylate cyclase
VAFGGTRGGGPRPARPARQTEYARAVLRRLFERLGVIGICVVLGVVLAGLRLVTPWPFELLELKALDLRFAVRGARAPTNAVTIVGIDERSLARYGRWPWPRSRLAELVERLTAQGARTIAFDAVFDQADAPNDAAFAAAMHASGRVVVGEVLAFDEPTPPSLPSVRELAVRDRGGGVARLPLATAFHGPIPALAAAAADAGHVNFLPDGDGGFRRVPLAIRLGDAVAPALSVAALRHWLGGRTGLLSMGGPGETRLVVGDHELPIDDSGELRIDFLGPTGTVPAVSALDVLEGRVSRPAIDGKLVLIAPTAVGFDSRPTPFSGAAPGVEIHASVIDNLLVGRGLVRPPWLVPIEAAGIVALGGATGVLIWWRAFGGAIGALALYAIYAAVSQLAFAFQGVVATIVYPFVVVIAGTIAGLGYQYATEARQRRWVRNAFERYVGGEVADLLAREPERLGLGGERRTLSILFTDIRGFSSITERMTPETLAELLTEHLGAQTSIVFRHEGFVDKYIGDAIMAFWGAPLDVPDHARRACLAALDIAAAMPALRARWHARGWPEIHIGVGVDTGDAVVGNFGSAERFSYTAISDHVNLASRLEGLNKEYGTGILVSEHTRAAIGDEFVCREIDCVQVKGKAQPVTVYELLCRRADDAGGRAAQLAGAFSQAFMAYRQRRFADAIAVLEAVRHDGADPAAVRFIERCRTLAAHPPPEGWNGVSAALTN